ncbi:MAG TPA: hypothetical protein VFQ68_45985 [Streptosporangiaceae bacterium]|nr:hypothetical protein [Streptosporangiaceae bacterium]
MGQPTAACTRGSRSTWSRRTASRPSGGSSSGPRAERALLPAVRDATADSFVLADGFSCRTQIEQAGTGRTPVHLAEILAAGLRGEPPRPERPARPGAAEYARLGAFVAAAAGASAAAARLLARRRKRV